MQSRFRFSLRVLIYVALLAASVMWLVDAWPPWKLERTFGGQTKPIRALAFSPDGRRLFSGGEDGALHSISMEDGKRWIATGANPDTIHTISVSPDSARVFAGGSQRTGSMWEAASGKKLFTLEKLPGEILASAYAPDGSFLVTGTGAVSTELGGIIRIWDTKDGIQRHELVGHKKSIVGVAVSPDAQHIYSGSSDETIRIWSVKDAKEIFSFKIDGPIESFGLNPDGTMLAIAGKGYYIFWNTAKRQVAIRGMDWISGHRDFSWTADSKRLLSANGNRTLQIREIDALGWRNIRTNDAQTGCCSISPDGKRIAFLTTPNTIGILVNQRPEAWFGIFHLPALWLTLLMAAALLRTILAERKVLAESKPPA